MSDPVPLDPDEGPTAWVWTDDDGLIHLAEGADPNDPAAEVALNRREFTEAGIHAGIEGKRRGLVRN